MSPTVILLVGLTALLVLIPTRRLQLAGWKRESLTLYFLGVWFLGTLVAVASSPARFLIPFLLILYLAPFVTLRDGLDRLLGRPPAVRGGGAGRGRSDDRSRDAGERPPIKDVTPPEERDEGRSEERGR